MQEDQGYTERLSAERDGEVGKKRRINLVKHSQGSQNSRKREATGAVHEHIVSDLRQGSFSKMEWMKVQSHSKRILEEDFKERRRQI